MTFVSAVFLLLYAAALCLRFLFARPEYRTAYLLGLLLLSLVFYGWNVPSYLILLFTIVSIHYCAGLFIEAFRQDHFKAKLILFVSISASLLILAYYKYAGFLLELAASFSESNSALNNWGRGIQIVLPVAISFYVFQPISYSVDVYRGQLKPERRFLRFFLFLGFFPQLVAGPIVRASQFLYQFNRIRRPRQAVFLFGTYLIIRGFFLKMVVADNLAVVVDRYWPMLNNDSTSLLLIASVAVFFSVQLLCDFMAYTDIARGIAYQLGFRLPINFNAPYIAATFKDFWRRWHITLSTWFRDYVFIPLGGSQNGLSRNLLVLMIVFVLSGLWHGANKTFIVWGALNGGFLVLEVVVFRLFSNRFNWPFVSTVSSFFWFLVVQLGWIASLIYFRSNDIAHANDIFTNAMNFNIGSEIKHAELLITGWVCCIPVLIFHVRALIAERTPIGSAKVLERALVSGVMLAMTLMFYAPSSKFIYFQF